MSLTVVGRPYLTVIVIVIVSPVSLPEVWCGGHHEHTPALATTSRFTRISAEGRGSEVSKPLRGTAEFSATKLLRLRLSALVQRCELVVRLWTPMRQQSFKMNASPIASLVITVGLSTSAINFHGRNRITLFQMDALGFFIVVIFCELFS